MNTRRFLISLFTLPLCAACASAPAAPVKPVDSVGSQNAEPSASTPADAVPTEAPKEAPKPAETGASAAPTAAKISKLQIDGVTISEITAMQLVDVLKKRGWDSQPLPETRVGKYEQVVASGRKDKTNKVIISVTISRSAKEPKPITDGSTESDFAPKALQARYASTEGVAQTYDSESDVLVSVMFVKGGNAADAKKLLDTLVTPSK